MTDDELQAMWVGGASQAAMLAASRHQKKTGLMAQIRRLRAREGEERWPKRVGGKPPNPPPPHIKRAGTSTLPPLASLSDG